MKVCIIVEGCYPYVVGGVSSWVHSLIKQFPKKLGATILRQAVIYD